MCTCIYVYIYVYINIYTNLVVSRDLLFKNFATSMIDHFCSRPIREEERNKRSNGKEDEKKRKMKEEKLKIVQWTKLLHRAVTNMHARERASVCALKCVCIICMYVCLCMYLACEICRSCKLFFTVTTYLSMKKIFTLHYIYIYI